MPYLNVPGGRLWYQDSAASGPPVVFVHPAAGSSQSWQYQLPAFAAAGFRCITYDLRGWGQSRPAGATADPGYLSDDLEALRQGLGLDRFAIVAAAYGGFGALDYALRFPEQLQALVLATTQAGVSDPAYVEVRDRAACPEIRALPVHLRELGPSYRAEDPDGVQRWLRVLHEANAEGAPRQQLRLQISLPMLQTLRVPTLLLAAGADLLAPPGLMRLLHQRIPHAGWAVVAEAGHSAHWERPDEWNRLVREFLHTARRP